jgi:diketogulonate reductase-like aldo/keto reductase
MRSENLNGISLPKIGFGTWRIGGGSTANPSLDAKSSAALRSALALGYTHFDTAETYGAGHAEELLGRAINDAGTDRGTLFITSKVKPEHLRYDAVLRSCNATLARLGTEYLDLYLIHWPDVGMNLAETFRALNKLVQEGTVRHLGVSNFNLKLLRQSQDLCESSILTDQVPYSLSERHYVRNGVLDYCQSNGVILTAYSPLGDGRLNDSKSLAAIADHHRSTPHQIALAWLASQPRVITIPMSSDPRHQEENLLAADIVLTQDEADQLTSM